MGKISCQKRKDLNIDLGQIATSAGSRKDRRLAKTDHWSTLDAFFSRPRNLMLGLTRLLDIFHCPDKFIKARGIRVWVLSLMKSAR